MIWGDADLPTAGTQLVPTSSRTLPLKIHKGISKDTACKSTASPPDLLVMLSLPLLIKTSAYSKMLTWVFKNMSPLSSYVTSTWINHFLLSSTCLMSVAFTGSVSKIKDTINKATYLIRWLTWQILLGESQDKRDIVILLDSSQLKSEWVLATDITQTILIYKG